MQIRSRLSKVCRAESLALAAMLLACSWLLLPNTSSVKGQGNNPIAVLSAASFAANASIAPDSIVVAFGQQLATGNASATTTPLPTQLAGTTVQVNGRAAGLFFVSAGQVNFLIPPLTETGTAQIVIRNGNGVTSSGTVHVRAVAPALFTANANGLGLPAAVALRVRGVVQTYEALARFDSAQGKFFPVPIDLGPSTDRVFLVLYGTGFRGRNVQTEVVTARIGGLLASVLSVDKVGAGLDQINVEIPRSLNSSGAVKILVSVTGALAANETEVEIAQPCGSPQVQINSLSTTTLLAGQELIINGANFASVLADNAVRIVGDETQPEAQVLEATPTRLRVLVPFGSGSGRVTVSTQQGTGCSAPVTLRTSVSGFVQDGNRQPIRDITLRYVEANLTVKTNAEGAFVLPDTPPSQLATIEVDGTTAASSLPYPKRQFKMRIRASRDNQVNGYLELKQATGSSLVIGSAGLAGDQSVVTMAEWPTKASAPASAPDGQIQTGQVILDVPNNATVRFPDGATSGSLTLTVLESGRTPGTLPSGQFSPVIAQITPFGATITPGAKLTFPNPDGYAPNSKLKLFRLDQRTTVNGQPNPTLGQFIEVGTDAATVSADGQRIESTVNAVTETSYYFASGARTTVTLIGRVVENNLNRTPVRRSLVNARGQGIFTDGNGGFVIRNVPVNASAAAVAQLGGEITLEPGATEVVIAEDRVGVEADFMRPSTRVDRSQQESVPPMMDGPTVSPDLVLTTVSANRLPSILAPASITMNANTTREIAFFANDPDVGQVVQVTVSGASFATVSKGSGDNFTLKLTPGANDGGNYTLTLTANDGQGGTSTQAIKLQVNGVGVTADDQVVIVDKNTPKAIRLTGSDPTNRPLSFVIVTQPGHGALSGTLPNLTYTPMTDYVGADSFTFKARAGLAESNVATVTIQVRGGNTAPTLTVPGNQSTNGGETLKFTISASDANIGQTLTFARPILPPGATIEQTNPTSLQFSWTPSINQAGDYEVTFTVADNGTPPLSISKKVQIIVEAKWAKTSGPEGGIISAITAVGTTLFAGTSGDGIYQSNDNGQSWTAINSGLSGEALYVTSIRAVGNQLFVGTRGGVYRSSDNRQSWTAASNGLPSDALAVTALEATGGSLFVGLRAEDDRIVGKGKGVYRSSDNGQSWLAVNAGFPDDRVYGLWVNVLQAVGGNLFAGTPGSGLYRLSNNGQSWSAANNGFNDDALDVTTLHAVGNNLFVGSDFGGVYRSSDNGQNWTAINSGLGGFALRVIALYTVGNNLFVGTATGVYRLSESGQNWVAANNGISGRALIVLAWYSVGSVLFAGTSGGGVYRSSDNGQNWVQSSSGISATTIPALLNTKDRLLSAGSTVSFTTNKGKQWIKLNSLVEQPPVVALYTVGNTLFAGTFGLGIYQSNDNGQSWTAVNNGLSGTALRVRALFAIGNSLFAATAGSGIYRTTNNGQSWEAINNGLLSNSLSSNLNPALFVNTLHVLGNTLFAGTEGGGIYRSSNNGQSWEAANDGLLDFNSLRVRTLYAFGNSLYAGTLGGVYQTSDKGESWIAVNEGLSGFGLAAFQAVGRTLFAVTYFGGVYRLSDNGQNWIAVNSRLADNSLIVLSLYAVGNSLFVGTLNGVYRSLDNGQNWVAINQGLSGDGLRIYALSSIGSSLFLGAFGGGVFRTTDNGQNWVTANIGLSGNAFNATALCTVDNFLFAGTEGGGISRTTDNGLSWISVNYSLFVSTGENIVYVKTLHAFGSTLIAGTSKGVFVTADYGQNWYPFNKGLPERDLNVYALQNIGPLLFAGTSSGVYQAILGNTVVGWVPIENGFPFGASYVNTLYLKGNDLFAGTNGGIFKLAENRKSWIAMSNGLSGAGLSVQALHLLGNDLFAGTSGGVYKSVDNGSNWSPFSLGLTQPDVLSLDSDGTQLFAGTSRNAVFTLSDSVQSWREKNASLSIRFANAVTADNTTLLVGTLGGGIFRSNDQGQTWTPANTNLPSNANIQSVITSGTTTWAASFGDGVYRSSNQGTSWTSVNTGLTNKAVNRLFLNGTTLYAGTEGGVYRSTNNGDNWMLVSTGMGTLPVDSFAVLNGTVYAGTDGNGVYRLNADGVSWTRKSNGLTSQQVRSLGVNGNLLYAGTIGGGICLSRDGGETWTAVNNQLPPTLNVFAFAVSGRKVYAGSIYGVFFTEDEGQNWKQINAGLLNTYVTGLAVGGELLFASTASGGVFSSRIPQ